MPKTKASGRAKANEAKASGAQNSDSHSSDLHTDSWSCVKILQEYFFLDLVARDFFTGQI